MLQLAVGADIVRKDGVGALYKGLSAGLLRQATYTTTRLGVFNIISEDLKARNQGKVGLSSAQRYCPMPRRVLMHPHTAGPTLG